MWRYTWDYETFKDKNLLNNQNYMLSEELKKKLIFKRFSMNK